MTNSRKKNVILIFPGVLVESLHYGPYSRYWWQPLSNSSKEITTYFPIRVQQKTRAILNSREFTVTIVVGNKDNNNSLPGYVCQCDNIIETANDPTNAISIVYSKVFKSRTRYSGSLIMGWNDENIIKKLNEDIPFTPHSFLLERIKIFVYGAGYSTHTDWFNAGPGFKSSLIHKFDGNRQALFVSKIEEKSCVLEIYQDQKLKVTIVDKNPIDVWKNSAITIKNFDGNQLFGIDSHTIKLLNQSQKNPTCSPQEWKNNFIMNSLFNFHLRRRTIININWYQLFVKWDNQESPLIELYNELNKIYPKDHQFSIREMCAWKSFLRAAGANNVTPQSHEEQVLLRKIYISKNYIKKKLIINFISSINFGQNPIIQNKIMHYSPNYIKWDFLLKIFQCLLKIQLQFFGNASTMH
jgi:hypothetical protein